MSDVAPPSLSSAPSVRAPRPPQHRDGETRFVPRAACETCAKLRATITKVEQEKEEALRGQDESFQKRLAEMAINRKRLDEERIKTLRQRIRKELEDEMEEVRRSWKSESTMAVEEARQEEQKRAESEWQREIRAVKEAAELYYKERMKEAVSEAIAEEWKRSGLQRESLKRRHEEELKSFQDQICSVQQQLKCVVRDKEEYACQFKELQLNYKRFIDLTDSALHSDYLLRLIRLGKPPGYAHCAIQTEMEAASL
ncbi:uncharacterized protein PF3D7_1120000-like isoform X2 [Ranitomeya imitator]|uniref:uncharacterized protein PF3D7_1120000-like isoform X2 n=1 Tax=Ranitomeya imitator TaxID=111125 RepID=UPI0037E85650